VELKLQAVRVGELGITALPNEVYGITGLKLKARSPLTPTFNIELANGGEGYIPPPEQHHLGGYTTWPARTASLELQAEPRIVEALLELLEEVSGQPRREYVDAGGAYSRAVLDSRPVAYWRLDELDGTRARDAMDRHHADYAPGVAFFLPGPPGATFTSSQRGNRCPHFAGGRLCAHVGSLGDEYSVEFWFWNGLPHEARAVTGYLFSRGEDGAAGAPGDHLGIGGTHQNDLAGKLIFYNGNALAQLLVGRTPLETKTWYHVVLKRQGDRVRVHLNGQREPEIDGQAEDTGAARCDQLFFGGRNDNLFNLEGKLDEVAVYDRVLSADEIAGHYKSVVCSP
jgi:hypothetical protein